MSTFVRYLNAYIRFSDKNQMTKVKGETRQDQRRVGDPSWAERKG